MVKISEISGQRSTVAEALGKDDRRIAENRGSSFQARLIQVEGDSQEERIKNLASMIIEQGEKLGKKVDLRELKIYKKMISEFLSEAVGNSRKFYKDGFLDRRGRYRVYATIKRINEEVDNLTSEVLKSEKDNIGILKRIDDIRGLIMDILL